MVLGLWHRLTFVRSLPIHPQGAINPGANQPAINPCANVVWEDGEPILPDGITARLWKHTDKKFPFKDAALATRMSSLLHECNAEEVQELAAKAPKWVNLATTKDHRLFLLLRGEELLGFLFQDMVKARYGGFWVPCIQIYLVRLDLHGKGYGGVLLQKLLKVLKNKPYVVADVSGDNAASLVALKTAAAASGRTCTRVGVFDASNPNNIVLDVDETDKDETHGGQDDLVEWALSLQGEDLKARLLSAKTAEEEEASRRAAAAAAYHAVVAARNAAATAARQAAAAAARKAARAAARKRSSEAGDEKSRGGRPTKFAKSGGVVRVQMVAKQQQELAEQDE